MTQPRTGPSGSGQPAKTSVSDEEGEGSSPVTRAAVAEVDNVWAE